MKKNNLVVKGMAMLMACAMVVGNTSLTAHAAYSDDGCYRDDEGETGSGGDWYKGESDSGNSGSSDNGNSNNSESTGGGSNSGSSDDGAYHDWNGETGSGGNWYGGETNSSNGSSASTASYTAPKAAGKAASAGKETFRAVAKAGAGTYKVTHKGIEIATFTLMDSEKNAVSCTAVALKQREDGKWAVNYEVADATGLTVGAPLDRTYMYNTLGVSYITINDTVIIDIEAEAAVK